jgi:hypothetical protein
MSLACLVALIKCAQALRFARSNGSVVAEQTNSSGVRTLVNGTQPKRFRNGYPATLRFRSVMRRIVPVVLWPSSTSTNNTLPPHPITRSPPTTSSMR